MAEMAFNGRSTLAYFGLDLVRCAFSSAKRKRNLVGVLGADGDVDYMKGLGEPTYESRTLQAEFTIIGRPEDVVARLQDEVEGVTIPIILPDDPNRYVTGDAHISQAVMKPGGIVVITAICQPWRLSIVPVTHRIAASEDAKTFTWFNFGKRTAVPELTVSDEDVTIRSGDVSWILTAGTHLLPELAIPGGGSVSVVISGGSMIAEYQEAIL